MIIKKKFESVFQHVLSFFPGNLGRVDYITEYEYDLFIRPDTCNPRFRVWFNFTVENVKADQVSRSYSLCFIMPIILEFDRQFTDNVTVQFVKKRKKK